MKTTSKFFSSLFILCGLFLFIGCSSDDDKGSVDSSNTPEIALLETEIILPQSMQNHSDPQVQELNSDIETISIYQMYAGFTQIPPGADVSHEPIEATGSFERPNTITNSTQYTVYTYSYMGYITIAYQLSVQDGMNVVEIFYSSPETNGFIKYMDFRQTLDGTSGTMKFLGLEDDEYLYKWTWNTNSDGSIFITMNMYGDIAYYELLYYPDYSGTLKYYLEGQLYMEYHWNSDGSGSWINHSNSTSDSWS